MKSDGRNKRQIGVISEPANHLGDKKFACI
jgi:hypothetical protein